MQTEALQGYKDRLLKVLDGSGQIRHKDSIKLEQTADAMDMVQGAGLRDLAICCVDIEAGKVRSARAALQRIVTGEYGLCLICDEEIPAARLRAVPWAERCIICQEAADRQAKELGIDQYLSVE